MASDPPTRPRVAVLTAALAVATVPLTYAAGVAVGSNVALPPLDFFLSLVFPYLVVVLMVYVGSRVVYGLGAAVRKARELGSYRLVQRLGEGGMGEVWRAEHRMLARPAAIKLIRPEACGATEVQGGWCSGASRARPRRRRSSSRSTRCSSTTSGWRTTGRSTT
jgi:hypothetical protein